MSSVIKEPSIKLIPSDPMTNTILIIYCVSSTGASVPYKSAWRKINPKKNRVEQIKNHNGSSYRCSPLDIECVIEATVYFQHQNVQLSRVVQSNMVKVSRQLKERRMYMREPILCRIGLDEISLEVKLYVQDCVLQIVPTNPSFNHLVYSIYLLDINLDVDGNQLTFRVIFKQKFEDFLNFMAQLLGWRPQAKTNFITLLFGSDLNRDIILLGIADALQKVDFVEKPNVLLTGRTNLQKNEASEKRLMKDDEGGHSKNKSQTSFSPSGGYRQKVKPVGKFVQMKRSFTNTSVNQVKSAQKKNEQINNTPEPKQVQLKQQNKDKNKDRQYLNVFEDEDLQLLNTPIQPINLYDLSNKPKAALPESSPVNVGDQPSINLRGSFEQLQKSFNSNLNEEMIDRIFAGDNNNLNVRRMQQQIEKLQKENDQLRKLSQGFSSLSKENNTLKRKYHEMKEEINRLQMERKVILTDKLRCEVNWHKEIQEKEQLKKELEHVKELLKNAGNNFIERSIRTNSFHNVGGGYEKRMDQQMNREMNRSPNNSFYR